MKVGFIGLGQMGSAMAANLVKAGHAVTVWNRSPGKADALVAAGAVLADTPAAAAQGDVVMTMLADDRALEAVVFGEDGILDCPALHVSHSTIGVALADRLAGERQRYVAAPVFGRPPAAEAGKLFVVAAGETEAEDRRGHEPGSGGVVPRQALHQRHANGAVRDVQGRRAEDAALAVHDGLHGRVVGQHAHHDLALGGLNRGRGKPGTRRDQLLRFVGRAVPHGEIVTGLEEVRRHGVPHLPEPKESDLHAHRPLSGPPVRP